MNAVQPVSDRFNVKILEDGKELAQLLPQFVRHEKTLEGYIGVVSLADPSLSQENNKKLFSLFFTSLMEVVKITNVVKDRIVDIHYKMGLSDKYKIIVAYDTANQLPQAMGLVLLDREDVKERKSIELYSLITSLWNLNCPQNANHPNQVKGAGASIVEFCKKLGAEQQAKYLYLVGAPGALPFYEKHGFKRVYPELTNTKAEENLCKRIPMVFDLEDGLAP